MITDPGQMATALIAHWEAVFTQREVDTTLLDVWHRELPAPQRLPNTGISTAVGGKGGKGNGGKGRYLNTDRKRCKGGCGHQEESKIRQPLKKRGNQESQKARRRPDNKEAGHSVDREKRMHRKVLKMLTFPKDSKEEPPPMKLTGQTCSRPRIEASTGSWKLQKRHLRDAIEHGKIHSAPGPDGLPYAFWKSIPDLAEEVLGDTLTTLARDDSEAYANESYTLNG